MAFTEHTPNAEVDYVDALTGKVLFTEKFYDRFASLVPPALMYGCGRPLKKN